MKKVLGNIVLIFFSSIVSLFLLEIFYRFYLFGWDSLSIEKMNSIHDIFVSGLIQRSNTSEIVYELKPNFRTYFELVPVETNSHALRDKEYTITKPENTFRVAVIGDSFTMPVGVRIEEAYHTLLEQKFNINSTGKTYEFINFGVGGYSLRQYWAVIQHKVSYYRPDLILIGFCSLNDHQELPEELFQPGWKVPNQTYPFYQQSFAARQGFKTFVQLEQRIRRRLFPTQKFTRQGGNPAIRPLFLSGNEKDYVARIFSKMGGFSKTNGIPIIIAYLGIRPMVSEKLVEIATQNNLYFVNLTLPFQRANVRDYFIHPVNEHPNGKANRIFASHLYEYLQRMHFIQGTSP